MKTEVATTAQITKMMQHGAPHVIHNEAELERYTEVLRELTSLDYPTQAQEEAIELLTLLIENYEEEHYPIPEADPITVVKFLLEHQGLTQRDMISEFGTESANSMFLKRKRTLSLRQVKNLMSRFNLPADVFLS